MARVVGSEPPMLPTEVEDLKLRHRLSGYEAQQVWKAVHRGGQPESLAVELVVAARSVKVPGVQRVTEASDVLYTSPGDG